MLFGAVLGTGSGGGEDGDGGGGSGGGCGAATQRARPVRELTPVVMQQTPDGKFSVSVWRKNKQVRVGSFSQDTHTSLLSPQEHMIDRRFEVLRRKVSVVSRPSFRNAGVDDVLCVPRPAVGGGLCGDALVLSNRRWIAAP